MMADIWTVETSLPIPRYHAGVTKVAGKMFVIGGFLEDEMLDRATRVTGRHNVMKFLDNLYFVSDCYDLNTGQWSVEAEYPGDVWEHACVSLNVPVCRDDPLVVDSATNNPA